MLMHPHPFVAIPVPVPCSMGGGMKHPYINKRFLQMSVVFSEKCENSIYYINALYKTH
jgi:hypothetical protein